jgi:hypothetical protein
VEQLAEALDHDDYETAASAMSDRVNYSIGDKEIQGPEAVVASYREASERARRLFDRVVYGHHVMETSEPNTFRVRYSDSLTFAGETLNHVTEQHVTVSSDQGVIRIVGVDLPGEREKVDMFLERHGLES